jgi:hypothetical protein
MKGRAGINWHDFSRFGGMETGDLIPQQEKGAQSDTSAVRELESSEAARRFFETVKQRLLHVNGWHERAGTLSARFQLVDETGTSVDREARQGDYFRIGIPGPGNRAGDGWDWVQVASVEETADDEGEAIAIHVHPASAPVNDKPAVAHFFSPESSSSFIVQRRGATVSAAVHGRNETPNTDGDTLLGKARNVAVAAGAITGASKLQWKSLVEGLVGE